MRSRIKTTLIIGRVLLFIIIIANISYLTNAETLVTSSVGVKYDTEILEVFNESEWVEVIVRLKDNSGINITGTKEERRELLRQKDEWFQPVIHNVLAILNEDEIEVTHKFSDGFGGNLIKEGFYKLINDTRIEAIYKDEIAHGTERNRTDILNESQNQIKENSESILLPFIIIAFLILIIILLIKTRKK